MNAEDAVRQMEEPELLTEVPPILKRLAKTVAYAFYDPELVVTMTILTNYPCIDEDTLLEKLQFDKRQLRGVLSKLKNDKLVKQRQIKEKQVDTANFNVYNFYFINYKLFVNVVKYKLDHIRRKLEAEEQQAQNRPSFQCLQCFKHFSDLEVDRLMDFNTNSMRCSFCSGEVEEDINHINTHTKGSSLGRFNEQMESIYNLLKECENINLAPEVLEPTPSTAAIKTSHKSSTSSNNKSDKWSSAKVKDLYDQNIKINVGDEEVEANNEQKKVKDLPVWISESTVLNEESNDSIASHVSGALNDKLNNVEVHEINEIKEDEHDIMSHLLAHENSNKKQNLDEDISMVDIKDAGEQNTDKGVIIPNIAKVESTVTEDVFNDSDEENGNRGDQDEGVDDKEENITIKVGVKYYEINEITDEIIESMTPLEHQNYLKVYNDVYEEFC